MILCVIPARGGSTRIPRKNVRDFCGRPMIAWSIRTALDTEVFDRVVVSTDDEEIARVATAVGAEVPFVRPKRLSDDLTGTNPVVSHACRHFSDSGVDVDLVCCLYATAPLVRSEDLLAGRLVLQRTASADFSFAATSYAFPVHRSLTVDDEGFVHPLFPDHISSRSQDLPEVVHDAGAFYWGRPAAFESYPVVFEARALPVMLPRSRAQDIDTPEDWELAESLFRRSAEADPPGLP